jgi:hypothetical protein
MKKLNYWFITGLADAESSFIVNIIKDNTRTTGFNIQVSFEINLKDKILLEHIKYTLGIGNIYSSDNISKYKVSNINELVDVILPHFKKHGLITQKRIDFEIFSEIINIIKNKEHLTIQGLQKIVNLKVTLNLGLSENLKKDFPDIIVLPRPDFEVYRIPDPNWLSGFSEGESCFYISIYKSKKSKLGKAVQLVFKLTQHSRDIELLSIISQYFGCGRIEKRKGEACDYTVTSIKCFERKIIPFFNTYPLCGNKALEFRALENAFWIMLDKDHLTEKGLNKIEGLKNSMNTKRQDN